MFPIIKHQASKMKITKKNGAKNAKKAMKSKPKNNASAKAKATAINKPKSKVAMKKAVVHQATTAMKVLKAVKTSSGGAKLFPVSWKYMAARARLNVAKGLPGLSGMPRKNGQLATKTTPDKQRNKKYRMTYQAKQISAFTDMVNNLMGKGKK
jgi:hypothetical protein